MLAAIDAQVQHKLKIYTTACLRTTLENFFLS
jgi:hypothetical protein